MKKRKVVFLININKKQNPRMLLYQRSWVFNLGEMLTISDFLASPLYHFIFQFTALGSFANRYLQEDTTTVLELANLFGMFFTNFRYCPFRTDNFVWSQVHVNISRLCLLIISD
ncbi:hypothetical protein R1A30_05480 [Paenibacillus larvae]|nr:hypothetical protein [Paenibacillus larvae]